MRRINITLLFLILLGLLLWEFIPTKPTVRSFRIDPDSALIMDHDCINPLFGEWELEVPDVVDYNASASIMLMKKPAEKSSADDLLSRCEVIVATRLDLDGVIVTPGEILYTRINNSVGLQSVWDILPVSDQVSGDLWIYTLLEKDRDLAHANPLAVFPIEIEIVKIFGIQPEHFRMIAGAATFLLAIFFELINHRNSR